MSTHTLPYLASCSQSAGCTHPPLSLPVLSPLYTLPPLSLPVLSPLSTLLPMSLPVLSPLCTHTLLCHLLFSALCTHSLPCHFLFSVLCTHSLLTLCISHHLSYQKCFSEAPTTLLLPLKTACCLVLKLWTVRLRFTVSLLTLSSKPPETAKTGCRAVCSHEVTKGFLSVVTSFLFPIQC